MDAPLPFASPTSTADGAEHDLCWVCLSSCEESEALRQPCKCPRVCHMKCLARWQLQSAGKAEEWECRFCGSTLPDWRPHLTPDGLTPQEPVMSIHFGGETYLAFAAMLPLYLDLFAGVWECKGWYRLKQYYLLAR